MVYAVPCSQLLFEGPVPREGLLVSHVINLIYDKVSFQTLGVVPKLVGDRVVNKSTVQSIGSKLQMNLDIRT